MENPYRHHILDREEAERRRNESMQQAEANANKLWKARAAEVIVEVAASLDEFTIDDIWCRLDSPREPRALGPLLSTMARCGICEKTSIFRGSHRPENHGREVRVWKSLIRPTTTL